ncbi:hypothetical protein U8335_19600 [Roseiconus lacunae]|uniref:hypothetical protein n=1 Tax=Roseiconus lacunae TaxID=2605694 RepID=UPI00308DE6F1|nr:hypothetical protein U8335_19600 [Stieleria sp. HD01]
MPRSLIPVVKARSYVLGMLHRWTWKRGSTHFDSRGAEYELGTSCQIDTRTVRRHIAWLRTKGYIATKRDGRNNTFRLTPSCKKVFDTGEHAYLMRPPALHAIGGDGWSDASIASLLLAHYYSARMSKENPYLDLKSPVDSWGRSRAVLKRGAGLAPNSITTSLDRLVDAGAIVEQYDSIGRRLVAWDPWNEVEVDSACVDLESPFL